MHALTLPVPGRYPCRSPRPCRLWWVAIAVLVLWLIGFVARPARGGGRW
ncbi:hypothetical protein [Streptomyces nojiriensis]